MNFALEGGGGKESLLIDLQVFYCRPVYANKSELA